MDSRSEKYYNDLNSEETEAPESHSPNRVNFSERLLEKLDTEGRSMAAINVRPFTTFLTRQKIFTVRKRNAYQDRKLTVHNIKGSKQNPLLFNHFKASLPPRVLVGRLSHHQIHTQTLPWALRMCANAPPWGRSEWYVP